MAPFSTIHLGLLLYTVCVLVVPTPAQEMYGRSSNTGASVNATCPEAVALRDVKPQTCCNSFLGLHNAIIDCLSKPVAGPACIGYCLLQNFRAHKILNSMSMTISSLITIGPKLNTHYGQCQNDLFEFAVGNTFDGDFRRIVCDDRLEKFFECMVKSWLLDCMGYDDSNERCVELQKVVKSSECSLRSFFTNVGTD